MGNGAEVTDVFWCSTPRSDERIELAKQTVKWWGEQEGIRLHVLTPKGLRCDIREFNRARRIFADEQAKSDPYIVTDDDCLPVGSGDSVEGDPAFRDSLQKGLATIRSHSDFAILSWWPRNAQINRWTEIEAFEDLEVMEHVSVGGIRMCRKEHILCWPRMYGVGYDREQADHVRRIGKKVGYFQHLRMEHLGEGKSDLWQL